MAKPKVEPGVSFLFCWFIAIHQVLPGHLVSSGTASLSILVCRVGQPVMASSLGLLRAGVLATPVALSDPQGNDSAQKDTVGGD